jgi:cytochrome o ubiquinol oxidase subunit 2
MNILDHQGPIGVPDKTTLIDSVATVLPTIVAIIAFAFWPRQSNARAADRLEFAYSEPRVRPQTALADHPTI